MEECQNMKKRKKKRLMLLDVKEQQSEWSRKVLNIHGDSGYNNP